MDVAKAVGVLAKYGGEIGDYEGAHKVPGPIAPDHCDPDNCRYGK